MANELKMNFSGTLDHGTGGLKDTIAYETVQVTPATQGLFSQVVSITTSDAAIAISGVGSYGYLYVKNLDPTNYFDIGPESAGAMVAFARIKPGRVGVIPIKPGITLRGQANGGTCKAAIKIYESD